MRDEAPRVVDQPEPGFFKVRIVKGGPFVAACITCEDGIWSAAIDGVACGAKHSDPMLADGVMRIWHYGHRVERDDHDHRLALREWALAHKPDHPAATPRTAINVQTLPSLF